MRAKDFVPIVEAQQDLFEVKMSPSSLKKLAGGIDALVGIEFEMIVPDIGSIDGDDMDPEEDMDMDETAYDIDDIINFFNDGDYNDSGTIRDLEEELRERLFEWQSEQIRRSWIDEDGKEFFAKWVRENVDPDDVADFVDKEEDLFGDREPNKEDWEKFIEEEWQSEGSNYENAYTEFFEEKQNEGDFDETEFLRDNNIRYMSQVHDNIRGYVSWPHWTYSDGDGEANLEELANDFSRAIGRRVDYSTGYHSGPRTDDGYTIEPDSSLSGAGDDAGLEFISPPLPLDQAIEDVKKVKAWADENNAYTNRSTGLHMNVSVPGFDQEKLDFVKLTLLLGDRYILERFGRSANTYARSAMEIIEEAPSAQDKELLFKKLKDNLETIASKVIHSGRVGKFTSINPKDNRVEFRGPGGDWLGQNFDKIEDTLYRTVVALDAAVDPNKYRKEYLKKLTKMFAPTKGSIEDVFVQYAAGSITREELKNKLKSTQSQRKQEKYKAEGIVEIQPYNLDDGDWIIEYDDPNGDNRRIFLKRTEQVSDDDKALKAAINLEPSWFKPDNIENIIVSEYTGPKDYAIIDEETGKVVARHSAITPLQAKEYAVTLDSTLANSNLTVKLASDAPQEEPDESPLRMAPNESEFVVINNTLGDRVSLGAIDSATALSRALRNNPTWDSYRHQIRILSASPTSEPDPEYKLYRVRGNDDSQYIAARSVSEAGRIALTVYPELGDRVGDLDIVLQDAQSGVINSYLNSQQRALDDRNQSGSNGLTSGQPGEGDRYIVRGADGTGSVIVRGASPENAIERARSVFNIPASRELEATLYV